MNLKVLRYASLCCFLTIGCASVGPDYVSPDTSSPAVWNSRVTGIASEADNPEILAKWWQTFNDDTLNSLIEMAVKGNKDLKSAGYALSASRAKLRMTNAGKMPTFSASGSAKAVHYGDTSLDDQNVESYSAGFDASWELDLFGGLRRDTEAARADMQATHESLRDALVSVLAETASAYISLRSYQSSIATAETDIKINGELYDIADKKFKSGLADASDVKQALYQLEYSKTTLNDLRAKLNTSYNRLAVLTGQNPGSLNTLLEKEAVIPEIPLNIVTSIPADVIRRRPDIRKSERSLAAQTARIGAAKSDIYPKFYLNGTIGYQSDHAGSLFEGRNSTLSIGPTFKWALFDLGAVRQNINVQTETQKQYLSQYEASVLSAFEEVENALNSFDEEYKKNKQLKIAMDAAYAAYDLELKKYKAGLNDYTAVKTAQSAYISYKDKLTQSTGSADNYLVALYKALGGGWETYEDANEK
ncbi:MAG: efflux transporter outer membrane subunit [Deferribacterales bacterium]